MPSVVVHNHAGRRYQTLADRLTAITGETLPLVESVTALPLPDPVVIRLMRHRAWLKAHVRRQNRLLAAEKIELSVPWADLRQAMVTVKAARKDRRESWPLIGAQATAFTPGKPKIAVLARALREGGVLTDEHFLYKTIAHETTHLAQYAVTRGEIWAAEDTLVPHLRGTAGRNYPFLLEGHACWADRQITTKLLGTPVLTNTETARTPACASETSRPASGAPARAASSTRPPPASATSSANTVSTPSTGSGRTRTWSRPPPTRTIPLPGGPASDP